MKRSPSPSQRNESSKFSTAMIIAAVGAFVWVAVADAQPMRVKLYDGIGGEPCDLDGVQIGTEEAGPGNEMCRDEMVQINGEPHIVTVCMNSDVQNQAQRPYQGRAFLSKLTPTGLEPVMNKQFTNRVNGNQPFNKPDTVVVENVGPNSKTYLLVSDGNDEENGSNVSTYITVLDPETLDVVSETLVSESDDNDNEGASSIIMMRQQGDQHLGVLLYNDNGDTCAARPFALNPDGTITPGTSNGNDPDLDFCNSNIPRPYAVKINDGQMLVSYRNGNRSDNRGRNDGVRVSLLQLNGLNDLIEVDEVEICDSQQGLHCSDGEIVLSADGSKAVISYGVSGGPVIRNGEKDRNAKGPQSRCAATIDTQLNMLWQGCGFGAGDVTHATRASIGECPDGVSECIAIGTSSRSDSAQGRLHLLKLGPAGDLTQAGTLPAGGIVAGGRLSHACGNSPNNEGREIGEVNYRLNPNFGVPGALFSDSKGIWVWPHAGKDDIAANYKNAHWVSIIASSGAATGLQPAEGALTAGPPAPIATDPAAAGGDGSGTSGACQAAPITAGGATAWAVLSLLVLLALRRRQRV